jgi:hypothetical protein
VDGTERTLDRPRGSNVTSREPEPNADRARAEKEALDAEGGAERTDRWAVLSQPDVVDLTQLTAFAVDYLRSDQAGDPHLRRPPGSR